jgi:hypothetical protein
MQVHFLGLPSCNDEWICYGSDRIGPDCQILYPTGCKVSILSPKLMWRDCIVRSHDKDGRCFLVRYEGYDAVFDEWIGYGSERISSEVEETPLVGTMITVLSPYGAWRRGTVVRHDRDGGRFLLNYVGDAAGHDEWIEYGSERIAPPAKKAFPVGSEVSVLSPSCHWRTCIVLRHDSPRSRFYVQYEGFGPEFNEWIDYASRRIEPRKLIYPGPPRLHRQHIVSSCHDYGYSKDTPAKLHTELEADSEVN